MSHLKINLRKEFHAQKYKKEKIGIDIKRSARAIY